MKRPIAHPALPMTAAALFLLVAGLAFGQVDKDELAKGQGTSVTFINYVGPHNRIDTVQQIVGIGTDLGRGVGSAPGEFTVAGKYRLIHAVGAPEGTKLDADIFILEAGSEVDDVVNIIRMVSGYLQAAYNYSPADAQLLARFVVYYNAVFRGNMQYLGGVYKTIVMSNVTAENAGIATKYSDWPGKTRMLVPLTPGAGKGNLAAVPAGQLATEPVIKNLQEQPGKALPERKDLTELQQRGIEQNQQKAQDQQKQLQQDQQKLAEQAAGPGAVEAGRCPGAGGSRGTGGKRAAETGRGAGRDRDETAGTGCRTADAEGAAGAAGSRPDAGPGRRRPEVQPAAEGKHRRG